MSVIVKLKTAHALGISNIIQVLGYRLKAKTRNYIKKNQQEKVLQGTFFTTTTDRFLPFTPTSDWHNSALYFGWWLCPTLSEPPNWHWNPMSEKGSSADKPWWQISDFDKQLGDIKLIWEASRFTWVLAFAERYLAGDKDALSQLNKWLNDWCEKNPPYMGVNWKCGQEAGIRVLHLAMAAVLLEQVDSVSQNLMDLIRIHLQRILPTLRYAISQNNNHGTSEAAALYIGGSWLAHHGYAKGKAWEKVGRKWLEKLVARLIETDGSFSQYSVNYHRVMLDTLSMVEIWRLKLNLNAFSDQWYGKAIAVTTWLSAMVDPITGHAPNLGANDSAYLFPLGNGALRDFRMSVQTASVLFQKLLTYRQDGLWNARLKAVKCPLPSDVTLSLKTSLFDQGGYAILRKDTTMALLRYPRFRFRPSQADLLHVDLWHSGINLLRDAGTYSYHANPDELAYFPGTKSHNTIEFDDRDQMPRLSRFLFGDWLKTEMSELLLDDSDVVSCVAAYRDRKGAYHKRQLILSNDNVKVIDTIDGVKQRAILRWRLSPIEWRMENNKIVSVAGSLTISSSMSIIRMELVQGWESLHYLQKQKVPVLEVEVNQPGQVITTYQWIV